MLRTMRNESTETVTRRGQEKVKPSCVVSYNSQMDTVDRSDQMIQPYNAARKTFSWYKQLMTRLLQVSLLKAFILYQNTVNAKKDFLSFQCDVVYQLLSPGRLIPREAGRSEEVAGLFEKHCLTYVSPTSGWKHGQKKCKACLKHGNRVDTTFMCKNCPKKPGLCLEPCFEQFHSLKN